MKVSITGSESYTLTGQTIDKLVRAGDGDAALLYLYMLKTHGQSTDKQAAEALGMGPGAVNSALALLSRMGLIEIDTETSPAGIGTDPNNAPQPASEPRAYTQDEVVEAVTTDYDFTVVVEETTRRLGKPLSPDDLMRLYGIYDNLRLPPEVILQLITHCINQCRTSGDGRTPSVRYIEKAAYTWEREGIFTIERAEEYLKNLEALNSLRGKIKQILQIRNREFSKTEQQYVDGWIKMGFEPETIALAYDKTIINTGSLTYPYMDAILKKWNTKGLYTLQQVQEKESSGKNSQSTGSSYNARTSRRQDSKKHGDPNREQLDRMRSFVDKIKEE